MKNLWIVTALFVLLLSGCKSKQRLTERYSENKIDTITQFSKIENDLFRNRNREVIQPVYFETKIPCDKDQSGRVASGNNYTEYQVKDGEITLKTNIDSVENIFEKEYRSKFVQDSINLRKELIKDSSIEDVTTVYVYPWWLYVVCIAGGLVLILYIFEKFSLAGRIRSLLAK